MQNTIELLQSDGRAIKVPVIKQSDLSGTEQLTFMLNEIVELMNSIKVKGSSTVGIRLELSDAI